MCKYVAYFRVSTAKQGQSGLGLEAQKSAVATFLNGRAADKLLASYQTSSPDLTTAGRNWPERWNTPN